MGRTALHLGKLPGSKIQATTTAVDLGHMHKSNSRGTLEPRTWNVVRYAHNNPCAWA